MDFIWFQFPLRSAAVSYFAGSYKSASLLLFTLLLHISWVIFWEICLLKAIFKVGNRASSSTYIWQCHCLHPLLSTLPGIHSGQNGNTSTKTNFFSYPCVPPRENVWTKACLFPPCHTSNVSFSRIIFCRDLREYRPLSKEDIGVIFTSRFNVFYIVDQECMGWCSNWNIWQASYFVALHAAFICKKCTFL